MYMLIDTGSANTWVMGSSCQSNACLIHNTFGSAESTTLNTTSQSWSLSYGTGEVQGVVAEDTVKFANYSVRMGFGLASSASDDFNNYPMDGILGLGRPSSDTLGTDTIMQVLDQQGTLPKNIVGVHLQRASDGTNDGEITFGGVDSSRYSGKLSYTKVANTENWEIAASDAGVNGNGIGFTGKTAIIDSGTSYILMPESDAQAVHNLIPGSSQNGEIFVIPCSTTASVYFTFSGIQYTVPPKDFIGQTVGNGCQSKIIGHQAFGPNEWILGDVFLKNVYTAFDFDNNQIGFGTTGGSPSSSSSSSTSSSSSSSSPSSSAAADSTSTTDSSTSSKTSSSSQTSSSKPSTTFSTTTSTGSSTTSSSSAQATTSSGVTDSSPFASSFATPQINTNSVAALLLALLVALLL